jgi:hypothetical protein
LFLYFFINFFFFFVLFEEEELDLFSESELDELLLESSLLLSESLFSLSDEDFSLLLISLLFLAMSYKVGNNCG